MRILPLIVFLACCACATPRSGGNPSEETELAATQGEEGKDGERLVCRRERVTGSKMRKKICRYEKVKRNRREEDQDYMRRRATGAPASIE